MADFSYPRYRAGKNSQKLKEEKKEKKRIEHQNLMRKQEEQKRLSVLRHRERLGTHKVESGLKIEAKGMKKDDRIKYEENEKENEKKEHEK